jgi:membrane protein required for colicin V production
VIWIDIVFLAPILWGAFIGFKKGLIAQVLGLASIGVGVWLGTQFPEYAHLILKDKVDVEYLSIASFIFIFLIVVITGAIIIKILEKLVSLVQLKFLNKIGGTVLGIVKVLAFLVIAVFIIESWDTENLLIKKSVKDSSVIYPVLNNSSKLILPTIKSHNIIDLPILKNQEN